MFRFEIHCSYVLIIWAVHSWFSCSCKNFSKIPLKGGKIIELFGEVQFCDVNFRYPSRPNQEPVLFAPSIMENIRHGKTDATDDEVVLC
ncbi:uncharacterized protein [Parasteatoda tepidariorum]|uniref:uncharacterized protein isoform X5 n=1 Tax=Parasteatoda tepidariorum TaxID=114398 RepID=UPI0039BC4569